MGSIYKRGSVLWIKYYRNGVPMRESSESDKETVARNLLRQREGDIVRGIAVTPRTNRVTFDELAKDVVNDYRVNAKRSVKDVERHFEMHLAPYFRGWRAVNITTADVRNYVAARQAEGASNGTANRELSALKRAFSLGIEAGKLTGKPKIPMLRENNVRTGFFEREQFEKVEATLAAPLRAPVHFAYITGWRMHSEVLPLQWRQVDFTAGTVRLDAGTTRRHPGTGRNDHDRTQDPQRVRALQHRE
jgi:integrase